MKGSDKKKNEHAFPGIPHRIDTKKSLKRRIRNLNIWQKMLFAYSLPLILLILVVLLCATMYLRSRTETEVRAGAVQAQIQADSFLSQYLESMDFILQQLQGNRDLEELLTDSQTASSGSKNLMEEYREYYSLNHIFQKAEVDNNGYRVGMYVPDEALYAINQYHFFPASAMQTADRPEVLEQTLRSGQSAYRIMTMKESGNPNTSQAYLTELAPIVITEPSGLVRFYPVQVGVRAAQLRQILRNARTIEGSLLFLSDEEGHVLLSTEEEEDAENNLAVLAPAAKDWTIVTVGSDQYYSLTHLLSVNGWNLVSLIPVTRFRRQFRWLSWMFGVMVLLLVAATAGISYVVARYYSNRIVFLNERMKDVQSGEITAHTRISLPVEGSHDEMDTLYRNFDYMIEEVQKLLKAQYSLGRTVSETEMKALQAQINPHFLYNTLDLINWGAMDYGADEVASLARNLGQFYRLSLNHGRSAITIDDELRHVQSYINIENAHYGGRIELQLAVPDEIREYACLNITLQPFVENSIVHGMGDHADIRGCRICIDAELQDGDILFTVTDDGPGIDSDTAQNIVTAKPGSGNKGFGIGNVNFRIKLCYGDSYGVTYLPPEETTGILQEDDRERRSPVCQEPNEREHRPGTRVRIRIQALHLEELEKLVGA
jgi:two-component system sensor histidine kinase YesM